MAIIMSRVRIIRIVSVIIVIVLLLWFLYRVRSVFLPFLYGFLLAYLLDPLVDWLEVRKISRKMAIIIVYLVLGSAIAGITYYALPVLARDLSKIIVDIPQYTHTVQQTIEEFQIGYQRVPIPEGIRQVCDQMINEAGHKAINLAQGIIRGIVALFSQTINLILAPILSFYLLLEFSRLGQFCLDLVPVRFRGELAQIGGEIGYIIRRFIRGNLLVALLVGVLAVSGLFLIGMDYPLLIGIMVGITNFIPYFGAVISAVLAVFMALLKSKWLALYVLGLMLVIQQLEGNIIAPKILGDSVGLHPLVIILVLLIAGELFGIVGLLVAVPLAAIIKVFLQHILQHLIRYQKVK